MRSKLGEILQAQGALTEEALREALAALTEGTEALSGTVSYEIKTMALHKRRVKRS